VDKIAFPYRSSTHLLFLHVVAESGSWEKYGLDVEYDKRISSHDAHVAVMNGDIEFVSGNHISPYGHRTRGDKWVYLGQTVNCVPGRKLVVRADSNITRIEDLRGKVVGSRGAHPCLNDWLQLKQHGLDTDRGDVVVVDQYAYSGTNARKDPDAKPLAAFSDESKEDTTEAVWKWVLNKEVDAAFLQAPQCLFAAEAGLKLIDIEPFPMIYFTTLSSGSRFVEAHPDIVERFLKAIIEGIHFFKTQPERVAKIIRERYKNDGLMSEDIAKKTYEVMAEALEPKLYPSTAAIDNVYLEGIRHDKDAAKINPTALWDLHYIRRLDDSGFVDALYKKTPNGIR